MIHVIDDAIRAINEGKETPDAYYYKSTLIATSQWKATDGWRGYTEIIPEAGYKLLSSDWLTGNWSDAPSGNSSDEVEDKLKQLEKEHGDIFVILTPTSNVFSTGYDVLIKDPDTKPNKGKPVGHKTRLFEDDKGNWSIRYHATTIISYDVKHAVYTLNSGGWLTRTTKDRINKYLPDGCYISQKNYKWYLHRQGKETRDFEDGMQLSIY